MNEKGFSLLETLIVIVVGLTIIIGGILLATHLSRNAKVKTFKEDSLMIISSAKNEFKTLEKTNNTEFILNAEYQSMCITISGLIKNGLLIDNYEKYEGYVVIEKKDDNYITSIWLTDNKLMINGYEESKINDLSYNKGVDKFDSSVSFNTKTNYNSSDNSHGGTGNKYSGTCINEKVEKDN